MNIKKAILTGGGRATRLRPITITINKHLIPLANKPMIFHAIDKVVAAGITEIFINTNPGETELQKVVGDGERWGIKIKYFEQQGGPQGVAHVVNQAKAFIGDDPFLFYLSDNIILGSIHEFVSDFTDGGFDCMLALSKVPDPNRFGVPVFDKSGVLVDVLEKPENPPSNYAVTGIYIYGPKLFFKAFEHIEKSARGEYEISSIHSYLLKNNYKVGYKEITGWWKDTGKPEDLIHASGLLLQDLKNDFYINLGKIDAGVKISDHTRIEEGAVVKGNCKIFGPVVVGKNCVLENCIIGPNVTIGDNTKIANAEIKDSIIFSNVQIDASVKIASSIIGDSAKVFKTGQKDAHRLIVGDHTLIEL